MKKKLFEFIEEHVATFGPDKPIVFDVPIAEGISSIGEIPDGWNLSATKEIGRDLPPGAGECYRVLLTGPQYRAPEPMHSVPVKPVPGETLDDAFKRVHARLEKKHGWRFHILDRQIFHPARRNLVEVWNPGDWMQARYPQYTLPELASIINEHVRDVQLMDRIKKAQSAGGKKGHLRPDAETFGFTCSDCEADYRERIAKGRTPAQARYDVGIKRELKGDKLKLFKERLRQYARYHKW